MICSTTLFSDSMCWTFTRRDDVDPRGEELVDILPALGVARARGVGVGQFVDEGDIGMPRLDRVDIEFAQCDIAVTQGAEGDDGQAVRLSRGGCTPMGLEDADDDVPPVRAEAASFLEHLVGLADARGGAEEHPHPTPPRA